MRFSRSFLVLIVACLAVSETASAQEPDTIRIYTIHDVHVDIKARTAATARDNALRTAGRIALPQLYAKLVAADDVGRLPLLSEEQIRQMVLGLEVTQEQRSATRYIASIDVTFDPSAIGEIVTSSGVPFSDSSSKPTWVFPLFETAGTLRLWAADNSWATAWKHPAMANFLTDFQAAPDQFAVRQRTSALLADTVDAGNLLTRLEPLGAEDVIIAVARLEQHPSTGRDMVLFEGRRANVSQPLRGRVVARTGEARESLFERAALVLAQRVDDIWKLRTLVTPGQENSLTVAIPLRGGQDWPLIRKKLSEVATIKGVSVRSLALPFATLDLKYVGALNQLSLTLEQVDLKLEDLEMGWVLSLSDVEYTATDTDMWRDY